MSSQLEFKEQNSKNIYTSNAIWFVNSWKLEFSQEICKKFAVLTPFKMSVVGVGFFTSKVFWEKMPSQLSPMINDIK